MGWRTTSVETVKIEDENPLTWLGAAVKLSQDGRISQALEYLGKARRYGRNNQEITIRCDMIETVIHYDQGDVSAAHRSINRNDETVKKMVMDNLTLLTAYLHYDYSYWESIWKELLKRHLNDSSLTFFDDNKEYIPDRLLAELADDAFVRKVVRSGSSAQLKALFHGGYKLSQFRDKDFSWQGIKDSPNLLMYAASEGNIEMVDLILDNGINQVNSVDTHGQNALWYALIANRNSTELIKHLVQRGINVQQKSAKGNSVLSFAIIRRDKEAVEYLLREGAPVENYGGNQRSPLMMACLGSSQDADIAKLLIDKGADINKKIPDDKNRTILHEIAAGRHWDSGNRKIWKLLLENHATIDSQDSDGYTPIMLSLDHSWFFSAELEMANALHHKGASLTKKAYDGRSALSISKEKDIEWN